LQTLGHLPQQLIAGLMTKAVVDHLEVIQVEKQQCDHLLGVLGAGQGALQPVEEQGAIGQARERVMERQLAQLLLEDLALGDIAIGDDDAAHGGLIQRVDGHGLAVAPRTIRPRDPQLGADRRARLGQHVGQMGARRRAIIRVDEGQHACSEQAFGLEAPDTIGGWTDIADRADVVQDGDDVRGILHQ
jgi:hypothetical protein